MSSGERLTFKSYDEAAAYLTGEIGGDPGNINGTECVAVYQLPGSEERVLGTLMRHGRTVDTNTPRFSFVPLRNEIPAPFEWDTLQAGDDEYVQAYRAQVMQSAGAIRRTQPSTPSN